MKKQNLKRMVYSFGLITLLSWASIIIGESSLKKVSDLSFEPTAPTLPRHLIAEMR